MLSNQEIIATVKNAFSPLLCKAEIRDYDSKLRFRISDVIEGVLRTDEVDVYLAQDEEILASVLKRVRTRIRDKGYILGQSHPEAENA